MDGAKDFRQGRRRSWTQGLGWKEWGMPHSLLGRANLGQGRAASEAIYETTVPSTSYKLFNAQSTGSLTCCLKGCLGDLWSMLGSAFNFLPILLFFFISFNNWKWMFPEFLVFNTQCFTVLYCDPSALGLGPSITIDKSSTDFSRYFICGTKEICLLLGC